MGLIGHFICVVITARVEHKAQFSHLASSDGNNKYMESVLHERLLNRSSFEFFSNCWPSTIYRVNKDQIVEYVGGGVPERRIHNIFFLKCYFWSRKKWSEHTLLFPPSCIPALLHSAGENLNSIISYHIGILAIRNNLPLHRSISTASVVWWHLRDFLPIVLPRVFNQDTRLSSVTF